VLLAGFTATLAFAGMETTFALLGARQFGFGPAGFGAVFAGVGVVMALVQGGLVGRLADRYGDRRVAVAGAVALGAGLVVLPFVAAPVAYAALAVVGVGQGLLTTTTASLIAVRGGHRVGGALGVGQSANAAARALGPVLAGLAFDLRMSLPYVIGGALCVLAALLLSRASGVDIAPLPVAEFTVDGAPEPEPVGAIEP
jgi:DHA1 family tetracycline resistance protein-like MFS transporter